MFDFAQARRFMVEGQIRTSEVTDPGIVAAMHSLARERFVPASWQTMAYSDGEIPTAEAGQPGSDRFLISPVVLGKLLKAAAIQPGDSVLHIGCGTGYGTAILSRLAGSVVAIEENETLASLAAENLANLGASNVVVVTGPLPAGYPANAPYDVIVIEGAVEVLLDSFADQLKEDGRLVTIVGAGRAAQGTVFRRSSHTLSGFPVFGAAAPVLPGFEKRPAFVF